MGRQDDDPTRADEPSYTDSHVLVRGVTSYEDPADAPEDEEVPEATRAMRTAPPHTGAPAVAPARSSTEMSEHSRRERRRERDRQAERTARRALIALFAGGGLVLLAVINSGIFDESPPTTLAPTPSAPTGAPKAPSPKATEPRTSAAPEQTPDIPALASLRGEGLTLAAEGLPQVLPVDPAVPPAILAGIETCRFAYAIWEFSPNGVFRFLTTCGAMEGQILVGAYEVHGSRLVTSPLAASPARLQSEFEIEKPSSVKTEVTLISASGAQVKLEVRQRITVIRAGMEGEGFFRNYAPKNTLEVQGLEASRGSKEAAPPAKAPPTPATGKDAVLELLESPR